jgi:hypothetical protein
MVSTSITNAYIANTFAVDNMTNALNICNISKYYLTAKTVFLLESQGLEIHNIDNVTLHHVLIDGRIYTE